jgi:S1-C subfamily serine protease
MGKTEKDIIKTFVVIVALLASGTYVAQLFSSKTIKPRTGQEYSATSVMITRYDGRSGGSGVILSSSKNSSKILTNAHVCEVVARGGVVRSDTAKGIVKSFKVSEIHDLCLITTNNNFKVNTVIAEEAPELYEDAAAVGHPALMPTIVTKGVFSQKELITLLVGSRPCTEEERNNDRTAMICFFFGAMPLIKTFEAQVVSSTIMPGSSGSPVFNTKGEISGLVFAGSGNFGYAYVVPFEYISNFVEHEVNVLPSRFPDNSSATPVQEEEKKNYRKICENAYPVSVSKICDMASKSLLMEK